MVEWRCSLSNQWKNFNLHNPPHSLLPPWLSIFCCCCCCFKCTFHLNRFILLVSVTHDWVLQLNAGVWRRAADRKNNNYRTEIFLNSAQRNEKSTVSKLCDFQPETFNFHRQNKTKGTFITFKKLNISRSGFLFLSLHWKYALKMSFHICLSFQLCFISKSILDIQTKRSVETCYVLSALVHSFIHFVLLSNTVRLYKRPCRSALLCGRVTY